MEGQRQVRKGVVVKRTDIAVYSPDGDLRLAVEVKARPGASRLWAASTLRNLMVHGALPEVPYFMLALPDRFYLWKHPRFAANGDRDPKPGDAEPEHEIDAARALSHYLESVMTPLHEMSEQGLELLVASWLSELMNTELSKESAPPDLRWLFDSGLYEAIKKGSVATEAVV